MNISVYFVVLLGFQLGLTKALVRFVKVTKLYACPNDNELLIPFGTNTFKAVKSETAAITLSLNFTIPQDSISPVTFYMQTNSCDVATRSCTEYPSWDFQDICVLFYLKFLDFMAKFQPPITSCPIAKGIYSQADLKVDVTPFKMIMNGVGRKYTTIVNFGQPGPKTLFCMYLDFKVLTKRN